jgi:putative ABC transport system permease protein
MIAMLFRLALRNAFRFRRRTAVTALAIAFGLGLTIIGISLFNGVEKTSLANIKGSETAHFLVYAEGYADRRDRLPTDQLIQNPDRLAQRLRSRPEVAGAACRLRCAATVINGLDELPAIAIGVEAVNDRRVFPMEDSLVAGKFLSPADADSLLIGIDLAHDIGLAVGDSCSLRLFASGDGLAWDALEVQVKGIFASGNPRLDRAVVFLPLRLLQESLAASGRASEIAVRLTNEKRLAGMKTAIQGLLTAEGFRGDVFSYRDIAAELIEVSRLRSRFHALVPLVMLLVAALGIVNTMLMAVMERTREIGLLRSMGFRSRDVLLLFVMEGGIIGVLGSAAGCILGGLGGWVLEARGIDISFLGREVAAIAASIYPIKNIFYADLSAGILAFVFAFGTIISVCCSAYPAWRASRLDPVVALRQA